MADTTKDLKEFRTKKRRYRNSKFTGKPIKPKKTVTKPSKPERPIRKKFQDVMKKEQKKGVPANNPKQLERAQEGFRSKNPGVKFMNEMDAATKGLDILTDKGPGKVKLALRGGGRAYGKNS